MFVRSLPRGPTRGGDVGDNGQDAHALARETAEMLLVSAPREFKLELVEDGFQWQYHTGRATSATSPRDTSSQAEASGRFDQRHRLSRLSAESAQSLSQGTSSAFTSKSGVASALDADAHSSTSIRGRSGAYTPR